MMRRRWTAPFGAAALVVGGLLLAAAASDGQSWRRGRSEIPEELGTDVPYDGRLTFARIRFEPVSAWDGWAFGMPAWGHDYPRAEQNFMRMLADLTAARTFADGSRIVRLDDPDLFRYPIAYLCEPGHWTLSEEEEEGLRAYFAKGGFVIFDDFDGRDWDRFAELMRRVIPDVQFVPMTAEHPLFDAFFEIERLELPNPQGGYAAEFYGVFEDNDPTKRILAIVNYNTDIGDYFEYSATGFLPVDISNDAYKIGVNYWMYVLTH
jgi:hypothetical protein